MTIAVFFLPVVMPLVELHHSSYISASEFDLGGSVKDFSLNFGVFAKSVSTLLSFTGVLQSSVEFNLRIEGFESTVELDFVVC